MQLITVVQCRVHWTLIGVGLCQHSGQVRGWKEEQISLLAQGRGLFDLNLCFYHSLEVLLQRVPVFVSSFLLQLDVLCDVFQSGFPT